MLQRISWPTAAVIIACVAVCGVLQAKGIGLPPWIGGLIAVFLGGAPAAIKESS